MSANMSNGLEAGKLDSIRLEKGPEELKKYFYRLTAVNKKKAIEEINNETLQFSTLYLLKPILLKTGLINRLGEKHLRAVRLANAICRKETAFVGSLVKKYNAQTQETLKWILYTGCPEDGLDSRYEEIMELTASLLVRYYRDIEILPFVADMIFKRNRKGLLLHNLVWAFFEARNPDSLLLLANYLYSQDNRDRDLARRLLGFIPNVGGNTQLNNAKMYYEANQWIQENSMFLYHTEECLHLTANPIPYKLSPEAKYLCKPVSPEDGRPFRNFSEDEEILLERFKALDPVTRLQLAGFSYFLYRRNMQQWNEWIHIPVHDQLRTMKMATGGRL